MILCLLPQICPYNDYLKGFFLLIATFVENSNNNVTLLNFSHMKIEKVQLIFVIKETWCAVQNCPISYVLHLMPPFAS